MYIIEICSIATNRHKGYHSGYKNMSPTIAEAIQFAAFAEADALASSLSQTAEDEVAFAVSLDDAHAAQRTKNARLQAKARMLRSALEAEGVDIKSFMHD